MKNSTFRSFFVFALTFSACLQVIFAQNKGCDGLRYKQAVFANSTKTTVPYCNSNAYTGGQVTLQMDIYQPSGDAVDMRPLVILAHGGSFITGDKSQMADYCKILANHGYVAASISYRLWPVFQLGFPDSTDIFDAAMKGVSDLKAAIRFFRKDAATTNTYKIDPANIFIGGYSAGAVAALHSGLMQETDNIPQFMLNAINNNGGFEGNSGDAANQAYDSKVNAILSMSGGLYRAHFVDNEDVPVVSIHGTADNVVYYDYGLAAGLAYLEGSKRVHEAAETAGVENHLETVVGGDHYNIYGTNSTFSSQLQTFFGKATTLMEGMFCSTGASGLDDFGSPEIVWSVSPNPSSGRVKINFPESMNVSQVQVLNNLGQVVLSRKNVSEGELLDISNLKNGIYSIELLGEIGGASKLRAKTLVVENH